jgi:hypothetical protein
MYVFVRVCSHMRLFLPYVSYTVWCLFKLSNILVTPTWWWSSDRVDARESIGDNVVLSEMCRMSVANWAIKSRWLNCRGEHLSRLCWKAYVIGLWSVKIVKWSTSSMWRKCFTSPPPTYWWPQRDLNGQPSDLVPPMLRRSNTTLLPALHLKLQRKLAQHSRLIITDKSSSSTIRVRTSACCLASSSYSTGRAFITTSARLTSLPSPHTDDCLLALTWDYAGTTRSDFITASIYPNYAF